MNFFEIRNYSGRNFNLVQENRFFAVNTYTFESKSSTFNGTHMEKKKCMKLYITVQNHI